MPNAKLHLIATPLGNRDDITLRALEELKRLECFFVEDSREFRKLLELYAIAAAGKEIHSYASHNMKEATEKALERLREGRDVGFASDRGTPAISDPGAVLVRRAIDEGFGVVPIPGPSSVTALLSVCGFPADKFLFLGFLSQTAGERKACLEGLRDLPWTVCFFESPQRVRRTVEELKALYPERRFFYGREMTKHFETYQGARLEHFDVEELMEKGEYALVLEGASDSPVAKDEAQRRLDEAIALRVAPEKEWAKRVASDLGIASSEVYNALQRSKPPRV